MCDKKEDVSNDNDGKSKNEVSDNNNPLSVDRSIVISQENYTIDDKEEMNDIVKLNE